MDIFTEVDNVFLDSDYRMFTFTNEVCCSKDILGIKTKSDKYKD